MKPFKILLPILLFLFFSSAVSAIVFNQTVFTSNGQYTVPAGISVILVEATAGGGAGGGGGGTTGTGGGGGAYGRAYLNVTPGVTYNITVGVGATGGAGAGANGGHTNITNSTNSTILFFVQGGQGGNTGAGKGGVNVTSTINLTPIIRNGGGNGVNNGGGGGPGGELFNGSNAAGQVGGFAGGNSGGRGGNASTSGNGFNAIAPGGGGGGTNAVGNGGNGGAGRVVILPINDSYSDFIVDILDENNQSNITNTNVTVTPADGSVGEYNYTNITWSRVYLYPIPHDNALNLKIGGNAYTMRRFLQIADSSNSTLSSKAYLSQGTSTTVFNVYDQSTNIVISNAIFSMLREINGTFQTVESEYTDATGGAIFDYKPNTRYKFTVSAPNYVLKTIILDPVLYASYIVKLFVSPNVNFATILSDGTLLTYPSTGILSPANQTFIFTISGVNNSINYFGLSYNSSVSVNITNAPNGSNANISVDFSNTTQTTAFNIIYWLSTTDSGGPVFFNKSYIIYPYANLSQNGTFANLGSKYYGDLGNGGLIIMAVLGIVLVVASLATFVSPMLILPVVGVLVLLAATIGFIPWNFAIMISLTIFLATWAGAR